MDKETDNRKDDDRKNFAISFRKQGHSLREIERITHISKSTLSVWMRNVEITQTEALLKTIERNRKAKIKSAGTLRRLSLEGKLKRNKSHGTVSK
jgi:transposase